MLSYIYILYHPEQYSGTSHEKFLRKIFVFAEHSDICRV